MDYRSPLQGPIVASMQPTSARACLIVDAGVAYATDADKRNVAAVPATWTAYQFPPATNPISSATNADAELEEDSNQFFTLSHPTC
ncbi:hypothetical protein AAVH_07630 [Aphelenchoides avenae]|nr:hypothetical protein AAVH_07630 [Aphelenchus avenae]